ALLLWESAASAPRPAAAVVPSGGAGVAAVRLELLGRQPVAWVEGEALPLSHRHAEILALLALNPRGLTAEQLALELYGERGKPVTVRAELSRLRALLAGAVLARPYRLARDVEVDFGAVERALDADDLAGALERYPDALLPESEVELVVERRERLDATMRRAIMAAGDTELLLRWCTDGGSGTSDRQAAELLLSLLPDADPARPVAQAHVARLRRAAA
ncbi:MAG TPA: helix-turn-helix domain-containing protein, partial [Solirubrobacteraceae bacterium]|nr:helix-turn-helix domain-containing protein [Solirubrobacteraceae bacterium]